MTRSHRVYDALKRAADLVAALVLLVVLSPLLAALALVVRIGLGSPVIFRQTRPGLGGHPFTLYKFRTMLPAPAASNVVGAEPGPTAAEANPPAAQPADAVVATDAGRLTPLGRFLRASSLDELPELLNVVKGEMSIVGPRPLLMEYLERYTPPQARRHEVRPGITGWAQVNGRNAVSWPERLAMDVWYVENRSLPLDLRILGMTVASVLSRRGVSAPGHATMEPFQPDDPSSEEDL